MDRSVGVNVNALRKKAGLPPVTRIADTVWISRRLNLIAETSAIGRKQPDWPDHHHVCGVFTVPGAAEQWTMPNDLRQFLEAGPPPVFMTLGSMYSYDTSPGIITEILVQGALRAGCRRSSRPRGTSSGNFPTIGRYIRSGKRPINIYSPVAPPWSITAAPARPIPRRFTAVRRSS